MILGAVALLAGLFLAAGGGYLLWFNASTQDGRDYLTTGSFNLANRRASAIVSNPRTIEIDLLGRWSAWISERWGEPRRVAIRAIKRSNSITVVNKNPSEAIFVGIAKQSDITKYLADAHYINLIHLDLNPLDNHDSRFRYEGHRGRAKPDPPASLSVWEDSIYGTGPQVLNWVSERGSRNIVIMNSDGSSGIDVDVSIGARIPLIFRAGMATLAGAIIALIGGVVMSYLAIRM